MANGNFCKRLDEDFEILGVFEWMAPVSSGQET